MKDTRLSQRDVTRVTCGRDDYSEPLPTTADKSIFILLVSAISAAAFFVLLMAVWYVLIFHPSQVKEREKIANEAGIFVPGGVR